MVFSEMQVFIYFLSLGAYNPLFHKENICYLLISEGKIIHNKKGAITPPFCLSLQDLISLRLC